MKFLNMDGRKLVKDQIKKEVGPYHSITADFTAEKYEGCELLDTAVEINIENFCMTWNDREKLMIELANLLQKYQI